MLNSTNNSFKNKSADELAKELLALTAAKKKTTEDYVLADNTNKKNTLIGSIMKAIGYVEEYSKNYLSKLDMYKACFQTRLDEGIERTAEFGYIVMDKLINDTDESTSLASEPYDKNEVKYLSDKFIHSQFGKPVLKEDNFFSTLCDMEKFSKTLFCEMAKLSDKEKIITPADTLKIIFTNTAMGKTEYDFIYNHYVGAVVDGENVSWSSQLSTIEALAKSISHLLNPTKIDGHFIETEKYDNDNAYQQIRESIKSISSGQVRQLIVRLLALTEMAFGLEATIVADVKEQLVTAIDTNAITLDDAQTTLFHAFCEVFVKYVSTCDAVYESIFQTFDDLIEHMTFIKTTFKKPETYSGL